MPQKQYQYVGPHDIRETVKSCPPGAQILSKEDLLAWIEQVGTEKLRDGSVVATFVIDLKGGLRLAPRRSEHVACASGGPVLSAGEMTITDCSEIIEVSNQSTGFCPEPESWPVVARAIDAIGVERPIDFTMLVVFRLCTNCSQRNLVKDSHFVCEVCNSTLSDAWNFQ